MERTTDMGTESTSTDEAHPANDDGLPEHLYTDIESTIHQHCGHDGQSDEANDWVTDLMAALTPLIVRELRVLREENKTLAQQYEAMCDHASAFLNERDELRRELGY
jgi:hypothetical protein